MLCSGKTTRRSRTITRTHEGGEYSEVVLCKVVHTPQKKTQPNPFKIKHYLLRRRMLILCRICATHTNNKDRSKQVYTNIHKPSYPLHRRASINAVLRYVQTSVLSQYISIHICNMYTYTVRGNHNETHQISGN